MNSDDVSVKCIVGDLDHRQKNTKHLNL